MLYILCSGTDLIVGFLLAKKKSKKLILMQRCQPTSHIGGHQKCFSNQKNVSK